MSTLKTCPFCGERVKIRRTCLNDNEFVIEHAIYNRHCVIKKIVLAEKTVEDVINKWNARSNENWER